jgi:hypothetical protein
MKKLIYVILIFIVPSTFFAQQNQLLELKSNLDLKVSNDEILVQDQSFKKKSPGLAILYSILLPGMGELYAGDYSTGKYFTIADGVFWGVLTGMTIYGDNKQDDYRDFASVNGGVSVSGKDEDYFANIGSYENIDLYNREQNLNRNFEEVYDENTHYWYWNDDDQRSEYRDLWRSSENAKNNVRFAAGALVLNRIVSAIFAVRAVSAHNKKISNNVSWNLNFGVEQKPTLPSAFVMNFSHHF